MRTRVSSLLFKPSACKALRRVTTIGAPSLHSWPPVSSGKPLDMLKVSTGGHMYSDVKERIEGVVGDFLAEGLGSQCPFGTCLDP